MILKYLASVLIGLTQAAPAVAETISGTASVIDGDTVEIHGQRIRLFGLDAPEGRQPCTRDGNPWRCGPAAANALADMIGHQPLTCDQRDIDRYGRIVAVCMVGGEDVGQWMVREGWAMAYRQYSKAYIEDENAARAMRIGLWSGEFMPPWEWRRAGSP